MANINFGFEHHAKKMYSGAIEESITNSLVPMVIETSGRGEKELDRDYITHWMPQPAAPV